MPLPAPARRNTRGRAGSAPPGRKGNPVFGRDRNPSAEIHPGSPATGCAPENRPRPPPCPGAGSQDSPPLPGETTGKPCCPAPGATVARDPARAGQSTGLGPTEPAAPGPRPAGNPCNDVPPSARPRDVALRHVERSGKTAIHPAGSGRESHPTRTGEDPPCRHDTRTDGGAPPKKPKYRKTRDRSASEPPGIRRHHLQRQFRHLGRPEWFNQARRGDRPPQHGSR